MTIIEKYVDLPPSVKRLLEKVAGQEFGNIPIVRETTWSVPEWTAICYLGNEVAAFCSIVSRIIFMNGTFYKAAGLHNLITLERFRGKGLATDLLLKSENFMFEGLAVDLGLLLCADKLVPFYSQRGWQSITCPVYYDQGPPEAMEKKIWKANAMFLTMEHNILNVSEIDLNGLPW